MSAARSVARSASDEATTELAAGKLAATLQSALANQLAVYGGSRSVDVQQAFRAANSQPYSHLHRPGIGVGGHCIPVYPHFLLRDAVDGELDLVRKRETRIDQKEVLGAIIAEDITLAGTIHNPDAPKLKTKKARLALEREESELLVREGDELKASVILVRSLTTSHPLSSAIHDRLRRAAARASSAASRRARVACMRPFVANPSKIFHVAFTPTTPP